jgi:hypothetical protein
MTTGCPADTGSSESSFVLVCRPEQESTPYRVKSVGWDNVFGVSIAEVGSTHEFSEEEQNLMVAVDPDGNFAICCPHSKTLRERSCDGDAPFGDEILWEQFDLGLGKLLNRTVGYRDCGGDMLSYTFFVVVDSDGVPDEIVLERFKVFYTEFLRVVALDAVIDSYEEEAFR